jgi:hypothetical protein
MLQKWEQAPKWGQEEVKKKGLLPCSQEPSTGPHSELDQSSPYHSILSL